jgi:hypothetical protein
MLCLLAAAPCAAQPVMASLTCDAAVERTVTRHPTVEPAAAGILVRITDIAFRAGATTNIEVIDAQRRARDAETAAAVAEDALRRAKRELLVAVGRFPG